jgi:hypothetical protein
VYRQKIKTRLYAFLKSQNNNVINMCIVGNPVRMNSEQGGVTLLLGPVVSGARILKHLLEAEKLTFPMELSFQRSESTTGLLQTTVVV